MVVKFYTASKKVNSTAIPSGSGTSYDVILKEGCSVMQPSVRLKWNGSGSPASYNYAYISDFHRYYWVRDWRYEDRQWTAYMSVDVLASYKSTIGGSSQYVVRSAYTYDGQVIDQLYPTKAEPVVRMDSAAFWTVPGAVGDQTFIVTTAGRSGFMDYYLINGTHLAELGSKVFDVTFYDAMDLGVLTPEVIKAITDPEESVCSIMYLPLKWSQVSSIGTGVTQFYLGYYDFTVSNGGNMRHIQPSANLTLSKQLNLTQHPDAVTRGTYLNGDAFTQRNLYIPTVGTINLDNNMLQGCDKVEVSMTLSLSSGMCNCIVYGLISSLSERRRLLVVENKVGVEYGFAARTLDVQGNMDAVTSSIVAAASGDYVGAAAGIIGAFQMTKPKLDILGRSGSIAAFALGILLEETFYRPVDEDNANCGRPLMQNKQISTVPGYIKCADAHIDISAANDEEIRQVLSYMEGGFYYE